MALKQCRECSGQVSTAATTCPHCGIAAPTRNTERIRAEATYNRAIGAIKGLLGFLVIVGIGAYFLRQAEQRSPAAEDVRATVAPQSNSPPQARTTLTIDRDLAQDMANVQKLEPIVLQARACVRNNIPAAYQSGAYGSAQVTAFFKARCFGPYSAAFRQLGFSELADSGFAVLVTQEVSPEAWQKALDDLKRRAR